MLTYLISLIVLLIGVLTALQTYRSRIKFIWFDILLYNSDDQINGMKTFGWIMILKSLIKHFPQYHGKYLIRDNHGRVSTRAMYNHGMLKEREIFWKTGEHEENLLSHRESFTEDGQLILNETNMNGRCISYLYVNHRNGKKDGEVYSFGPEEKLLWFRTFHMGTRIKVFQRMAFIYFQRRIKNYIKHKRNQAISTIKHWYLDILYRPNGPGAIQSQKNYHRKLRQKLKHTHSDST